MPFPFAGLFSHRPERRAAHEAYVTLVTQARRPEFYRDLGVPDTLDGRFELIVLHAFLILHRLRTAPAARGFGQALHDLLFDDMDRSLREMGAGDLGVGPRVKRMAEGFQGRLAAYQAGLDGAEGPEAALARNLYGTVASPDPVALARMAAYMHRQIAALADQPTEAIMAGRIHFAPLDSEPS